MRNDSVHSSSVFGSKIHSTKTGDDGDWGLAVGNIPNDGTLRFLRCQMKAFPQIETMRKFPLIFFLPSKLELSIFLDCEKNFHRRKTEAAQWFSSNLSMTNDNEVVNFRFVDCSWTLKQLEVRNKNFSQLSRKKIFCQL